jgi:hypothetical protein
MAPRLHGDDSFAVLHQFGALGEGIKERLGEPCLGYCRGGACKLFHSVGAPVIAFLYARLVVKKPVEPTWIQLHIPARVLHLFVAKIDLYRPEVVPAIRHVIPARVPKAVRMDVQISQTCPSRYPVNHQLHRTRTQSPTPFGGKRKLHRFRPLSLKLPKRSNFDPAEAMVAAYGALQPMNMKNPLLKVKLPPGGSQCFGNSQSVREEDQDQGRIALPVPIAPGHLNHFVHLGFEQMLPSASPAGNCSLYGSWSSACHLWKTSEKSGYHSEHSSLKGQFANSL